MAEFKKYPPDTPCWVDLSTPDLDGALRFYEALFGWTSDPVADPAAGGYTIFKLNGKSVAGVGPQMDPQAQPAWNTSVSVSDVDKSTRLAEESGAKVFAEPMDVTGEGRVSGIIDPSGATVFMWQPENMHGAEVANEPNTWSWNELQTRDLHAAQDFYRNVFGWDYKQSRTDPMPYYEIELQGRSFGGMMPMPPGVPADVPSSWVPYFTVSDCSVSTQKIEQLKGDVLMPNMKLDVGVFSMVTDPQGAPFAIIQMN